MLSDSTTFREGPATVAVFDSVRVALRVTLNFSIDMVRDLLA
jgi:hypothetical protein